MVGLVVAFVSGSALRKELEGGVKPSLIFLRPFTSTGALFSFAQFIAFFGPLIGLVLGRGGPCRGPHVGHPASSGQPGGIAARFFAMMPAA